MSIQYEKSRVRILVVDDEDSIRQMLVETLKDDGWDVDSAENGKIAQEKLSQKPAHIVLSDINMPEVTGIELLEYVKTKFPATEFVIMTSHATLETAMKAVGLGAYDYLNKPFEDISLVPKKMEQVAESILLRQQNIELLRRLKVAGHELKRLLAAITPLNGVIAEKDLIENSLKTLRTAFDVESLQAQWWQHDGEKWNCVLQDGFEAELPEALEDVEQAKEQFKNSEKAVLHFFKYQEHVADVLIFENKKDSLSNVLIQQLDICYQKVQFHKEIEGLANRDGLTKLFNHRYFQERLEQEVSIARRQHSMVSVLLMDVDNFKNFNDTNGHPAGDKLLRELSQLLSYHGKLSQKEADAEGSEPAKRISDVVARYGGEEFVMILPFTPYEGAMIKANRLVESIRSKVFEHGEKQPLGHVSVSMGVASFPDDGDSPAKLIEVADRALYKAKHDGRDRVVGSKDLAEETSEKSKEIKNASEDLSAESPISSEAVVEEVVEVQTELPPPPEEIAEVQTEFPPPPEEIVEVQAELPAPPAVEEVSVESSDALPPPPPIEVEKVEVSLEKQEELPPPPVIVEEIASTEAVDKLFQEAIDEVDESDKASAESKPTLGSILDSESQEEETDQEIVATPEPKSEELSAPSEEIFDISNLVQAIEQAVDAKEQTEGAEIAVFSEEQDPVEKNDASDEDAAEASSEKSVK